jgi:hypothetical protein
MKITSIFLSLLVIALLASSLSAQEKSTQSVLKPDQRELTTRDSLRLITRRLAWSVWRTDYYICTAIAYSKTLGKTPEDLGQFVGDAHASSWGDIKGISSLAEGLRFFWSTYKDGQFETVFQSDSSATIKSNRPYLKLFKGGPVLGVTVEEYDRFFWRHAEVMMAKIGFHFRAEISGDAVLWYLSKI